MIWADPSRGEEKLLMESVFRKREMEVCGLVYSFFLLPINPNLQHHAVSVSALGLLCPGESQGGPEARKQMRIPKTHNGAF